MSSQPFYATVGASGGFSLTAFLEWAKSPSTLGAVAFVGSTLSTVIGWLLARRAEINRANLEVERERREMEREQRYLDLLSGRRLQLETNQPIKLYVPEPESPVGG